MTTVNDEHFERNPIEAQEEIALLVKELCNAIEENKIEQVQFLLEHVGSDMTKPGGGKPLMLAVCRGHTAIVQLLLEWSVVAMEQQMRFNEVTPLHLAALNSAVERGHQDIVVLLLEWGVDVNARNFFGETPLHVASKHGNVEMVMLLLKKNADIAVRQYKGMTAVDMAFDTKVKNALLNYVSSMEF